MNGDFGIFFNIVFRVIKMFIKKEFELDFERLEQETMRCFM